MSRKTMPLVNLILDEEDYTIDNLKKLLKIEIDEELTNFLLDTIIERVKDINIESRGYSAYLKNIEILFKYLKMCINERSYYDRQEVNEKLAKISSVAGNKKTICRDTFKYTSRILDFLLVECQKCRFILKTNKDNIIIKKPVEDDKDNIFFPAIDINHDTLDEILSPLYVIQGNYLDLTNKYTFSIDSDGTNFIDDAISIDQLSDERLLVGIYITDISSFIKIGSDEDKYALEKGSKGHPMFSIDTLNSFSLNTYNTKNVIACMIIIDKNGMINSENDVKFFKAKIIIDRRLQVSEIPIILRKRDIIDKEIKKKLQILDDITLAIQQERRRNSNLVYNSGKIVTPHPRLYTKEKDVAIRMVCELMVLMGQFAALYANQKKYPFLNFVTLNDVKHNLDLFPHLTNLKKTADPSFDINILRNKNISKEDLIRTKYFLTKLDNQVISDITQARVSSPLWKYTDLVNQRVINHCFLDPHPNDKKIHQLEDNIKKTAFLFNEKAMSELKNKIELEKRRIRKQLKREEIERDKQERLHNMQKIKS